MNADSWIAFLIVVVACASFSVGWIMGYLYLLRAGWDAALWGWRDARFQQPEARRYVVRGLGVAYYDHDVEDSPCWTDYEGVPIAPISKFSLYREM